MSTVHKLVLFSLLSSAQLITMPPQPSTTNTIRNGTKEMVYVSIFAQTLSKEGIVYQKTLKIDPKTIQSVNLITNYGENLSGFHIIFWTAYPDLSVIVPLQKPKKGISLVIKKINDQLVIESE